MEATAEKKQDPRAVTKELAKEILTRWNQLFWSSYNSHVYDHQITESIRGYESDGRPPLGMAFGWRATPTTSSPPRRMRVPSTGLSTTFRWRWLTLGSGPRSSRDGPQT